MKTLVYSENPDLSLQLLGKAVELSGAETFALATNEGQAEQLRAGASRVYILKGQDFDTLRQGMLEVFNRESPDLVLIGSTRRGRELAPRIASAIGAGHAGDCVDVRVTPDAVEVRKLVYGGSSIATEAIRGGKAVVTVPPRIFQKYDKTGTIGEIVDLSLQPTSRVRVLETRPKRVTDAGLETAKTIVTAGRGFKKKEDLALLNELAGALGAKTSCTRPIAADLGWMDQWVGISGKKVAPKLYIACGVSGTIQHAAGIRDSLIIVGINSDEAAGIHELSDYSVVGDLYTVLPALTKAIREHAN
jgi:electron transfer flavoprotein alpha subunit